MIQRRVFVYGQVQGVSYRASTQRAAEQYPQLRGYVRNLPDGRVEVLLAGKKQEVLAMIEWCKKGPTLAVVNKVEISEELPDPALPKFTILG